MFTKAVVELAHPEGAALFNLSAFEFGPEAVLDRIPTAQNGIYAWFRGYKFRKDVEGLAEDLGAALRAPKFQQRTGSIAPYYELTLRSKTTFSEAKQGELKSALQKEEFRHNLSRALEWSILFQSPLYVGKSLDIRTRITQHLRPDSDLTLRLRSAEIELSQCYLLTMPLASLEESSLKDNNADSTRDHGDEALFEEIFSRLFNPLFSIRLG
jgi:hypothetical protein